MIRETFATAQPLACLEAADLIDLSWTPWRRIWLSERDNIWCLVDAEDYAWLSEHKWNVSWGSRTPWQKYAKRNVGPDRATLRQHREIMIKADPKPYDFVRVNPVDHNNGQTLDNRRTNLAWVTKAENLANRHPRGSIPSLDEIVRDLVASLGPRPELAEVPF